VRSSALRGQVGRLEPGREQDLHVEAPAQGEDEQVGAEHLRRGLVVLAHVPGRQDQRPDAQVDPDRDEQPGSEVEQGGDDAVEAQDCEQDERQHGRPP